MSIYVYVTRKEDPLADDGDSITLNEWTSLVEADPDLAFAEPDDKRPADKTTYAVWSTYPGGYPAWFGLADGNIEVKSLDDALLSKLRTFAHALGARIVSEEGDVFT